ncbi:hypothetical protein N658DRAFT_239399 [Parathielavia hyrcaniae]|uniref:Uncharacterized protein n=1 Tax=Parathielavia hyrcaniae TaxID=113614 RepID=A0AAN6QB64_9PEZI|nr:hypothetical protein N658DRAFT_239399 [Parathielavia hyrcaniae]
MPARSLTFGYASLSWFPPLSYLAGQDQVTGAHNLLVFADFLLGSGASRRELINEQGLRIRRCTCKRRTSGQGYGCMTATTGYRRRSGS